jgi:hypothetical protein
MASAISQHLAPAGRCPQWLAGLLHAPQVSTEADEWRSTFASFTSDHCSSTLRRGALRGSTRLRYWERLSHGLYVPRGPRPLAVELAAWQLVLPASACFTSLSSAVISLLDGRSESPWESVLRLLHHAAEVDASPQKKIYDKWGASWHGLISGCSEPIGCMSMTARRIAIEKHIARIWPRERRLVEIDWQRIGFTSPQLLYEGGSIIAGLDRLLGRGWDPSRLARWHALLDESVLRPAGRAQVTRRWKRGH